MMAVKVNLKNNSKLLLSTLEGNIPAALAALAFRMRSLVLFQMRNGYRKPIWRTGDLQRDVQTEVSEGERSVTVGNTLYYAPYVHEGTYKMAGRPYIKDALSGDKAISQLRQVAEVYLRKGL